MKRGHQIKSELFKRKMFANGGMVAPPQGMMPPQAMRPQGMMPPQGIQSIRTPLMLANGGMVAPPQGMMPPQGMPPKFGPPRTSVGMPPSRALAPQPSGILASSGPLLNQVAQQIGAPLSMADGGMVRGFQDGGLTSMFAPIEFNVVAPGRKAFWNPAASRGGPVIGQHYDPDFSENVNFTEGEFGAAAEKARVAQQALDNEDPNTLSENRRKALMEPIKIYEVMKEGLKNPAGTRVGRPTYYGEDTADMSPNQIEAREREIAAGEAAMQQRAAAADASVYGVPDPTMYVQNPAINVEDAMARKLAAEELNEAGVPRNLEVLLPEQLLVPDIEGDPDAPGVPVPADETAAPADPAAPVDPVDPADPADKLERLPEPDGRIGTPGNKVIADAFEKEEDRSAAFNKYAEEFRSLMPKEEGMNPWLIAMKAFSAMAAGQSPNALTNIAEGAKVWADETIKDADQKRAFGRQIDLSSAQYALEQVNADKARERQDDRSIHFMRDSEGNSHILTMAQILKGGVPEGWVREASWDADQQRKSAAAISRAAAAGDLAGRFVIGEELNKDMSDALKDNLETLRGVPVSMEMVSLLLDNFTGPNKENLTGFKGVGQKLYANWKALIGNTTYNTGDLTRAQADALMRKLALDTFDQFLGENQSANSISDRDMRLFQEAIFGTSLNAGESGLIQLAVQDPTIIAHNLANLQITLQENATTAFNSVKRVSERADSARYGGPSPYTYATYADRIQEAEDLYAPETFVEEINPVGEWVQNPETGNFQPKQPVVSPPFTAMAPTVKTR